MYAAPGTNRICTTQREDSVTNQGPELSSAQSEEARRTWGPAEGGQTDWHLENPEPCVGATWHSREAHDILRPFNEILKSGMRNSKRGGSHLISQHFGGWGRGV